MDKSSKIEDREISNIQARLKNIKLQHFKSGAIREDKSNKSRPDLISPYFTERLGFVLAKGANLYGDRNWEKGIPDESAWASLERHLMARKQEITGGFTSTANTPGDDHLGQAAFNLMVLIHNQELRIIEHTKNTNQLRLKFDDKEEISS